ncbi:putative cytochrome P450 [Xylaria curta]|nr:putative cytochrome P450 [Xylaria curta]
MRFDAIESILLILATGVAILACFTIRKIAGHDNREPPLAPQSVPLVGHVIGLLHRRFSYYGHLSKSLAAPIFTISIIGHNVYVATKPELIQIAQKQHKTLAFLPIASKFASIACGASQEARDIWDKKVNGDKGDFGLSVAASAVMRDALKPGRVIDDMSRDMIQEIKSLVDELQPAKGDSRKLGLYAWLRNTITKATTGPIYGPMNPYNDPDIVDAFWEFEKGIMSILIGFLPAITARRSIAARTKVVEAFEQYYKAGGLRQASVLAQKRQAVLDHKVPFKDMARYEMGVSIALLVNTVPAAFWTLLLVHSHPGLLDEIRKEVDACIKTTETGNSLDIAVLKESCPLLLSSYQEVLRCHSMGASTREVMEDTYLGQWLLKKGAVLQMPTGVIHRDPDLWGADADSFNPRRFLPEQKKNRPRDVCFRTFGGGKNLCPGRHFATNEILAIVAVFIAGLDMKPTSADGSWKLPTTRNNMSLTTVMQPNDDVEVEIKARRGFEDTKWTINLGESDNIFAMMTEDSLEAV